MSMVGAKASAHAIEAKNADGVTIYYRWNSDKTELSVTYRGDFSNSYKDNYSGNVVIPSSVTYGGKEYSVTSIGSGAFSWCSGLISVEIPNSVTSIGSSAFYGCSDLTSVTIPNSVTSIGKDAFYGTAWFNNQPDGVVYIDKWAYTYKGSMPSNTHMELKEGTVGIADDAFSGCSYLTSVVIPNSVKSIGNWAFYACINLTSIEIPNSVTSIGGLAFYNCKGLTSVTIPNSVTSIGDAAFEECYRLTSVKIPNSVTSIGGEAFSYCSGLTSVEIPNSVTSIGYYAFYGCSGLTSVEIPNSVTSIGYYAFYGCSGLTSVTSLIEEPFDIYNATFSDDTYKNATLYVPAGTKEKYEATEGWKKFANIVEMDETGIDAVDALPASSADAPVYNLNGQRVNAPVNGIYIKNGRKVLVK